MSAPEGCPTAYAAWMAALAFRIVASGSPGNGGEIDRYPAARGVGDTVGADDRIVNDNALAERGDMSVLVGAHLGVHLLQPRLLELSGEIRVRVRWRRHRRHTAGCVNDCSDGSHVSADLLYIERMAKNTVFPAPPYITIVEERGGLKIWIVDGSFIRGHIDEEFTNFGQHFRFPYIPVDELWLDQEAEHDERQFFIDHLLVEHRLMKAGRPYAEAIVEADRQERKERRLAGDVRKSTRSGTILPAGRIHAREAVEKAGERRRRLDRERPAGPEHFRHRLHRRRARQGI